MVLLGMLDELLMSVLEPGVVVVLLAVPELLMSELVPGVVVLPAPMEVPLPVVVSVLPVVPVVPEVLAVLLEVSLGVVVVDGVVLDVVDEVLEASSCLEQALRDRAAIRARAAHCAIGDLIIRELLEGFIEWIERGDSVPAACGSL
ncbi:hypothetical protein GCM10028813_16130 [Ramlibacter alkalitolerans]